MIKNQLKHILVDKNMSLAELARQTELHYSTVYNFAQDEPLYIYKATLEKVCAVLGVQPGDIFIFED